MYRRIPRPEYKFTDLGSPWVRLINKTGANSVKGTLVDPYTGTTGTVGILTNPFDACGVIYEDGIPDGSQVKVVLNGVVEVLLDDGTTAGPGGWMRPSTDTLGRAINTTDPAGLGAIATAEHFKEIGHCLGRVSPGGTDQLCKIIFHTN